ncbi:MAG: patatin-like phospholipase family protein [Lysobacteraceae bacterium]
MPVPPSMRRAFLAGAALILLSALPVRASDGPASAPAAAPAGGRTDRPCVGLVLGGGGARGAAHVGVLRVLERERIPVCRIAGTSMGAIVGSLYASGRSPDEIEAILAGIDWRDLFRDGPSREQLPMRRKDAQLNYRAELDLGWRDGRAVLPYGAVQGQKLGLLLRRLLLPVAGIRDFDRLPIPFRAVSTDITTGEAVVFGTGDLAQVVRASMAVPAVFAPIEINDRLLVDGGLVDNVPIPLVRRMGADVVIAVDVGSPLMAREALRSPLDVAHQMVSVLMAEKTAQRLATLGSRDVLLVPALGDFSSADFANARTIVPRGEAAAEARVDALRAYALPAEDYAAWQAAHRPRPADALEEAPAIAFVEVDARRTTTADRVARRAAALEGRPATPEAIDPVLAGLYAEGTYERIGWRPVARDGRPGILLQPLDKPWGPAYAGFGLQIADDFNGRSSYQLTAEVLRTGLTDDGAELRSLLRLGAVTELSTDLYLPLDLDRLAYAGVDAGYRAQNLPIAFGGQQAADFRLSRTGVGVRLGVQPDPRWSAELGLRAARHEARRIVGVGFDTGFGETALSLGTRLAWDSLDALSFPTRGTRAVATLDRFGGPGGSGWVARLRADTAMAHGDHHLLLGVRGAAVDGDPPSLAAFSTLGGFLNLSGALERGRVGERLGYARAVYYYRLAGGTGLVDVPTFVGASAEVGEVRAGDAGFAPSGATRAGSVFLGLSSPFGPVFLGYGRTSEGEDAWTLSFGNLIRNDD